MFQAGPDPGNPQISSDCPRKSLGFEIGVGDRLGTLKVSKSNRVFSCRRCAGGLQLPPLRGGSVPKALAPRFIAFYRPCIRVNSV